MNRIKNEIVVNITQFEPLLVAVDFDNTIIRQEKDFSVKEFLPHAKEVINWAHEKGVYIIIWTCRDGEMLREAADFLNRNNVKFDNVNENYPLLKFKTSKKICVDFYIDDKSFEIDWLKLKEIIKKKIIWKLAWQIEQLAEQNNL